MKKFIIISLLIATVSLNGMFQKQSINKTDKNDMTALHFIASMDEQDERVHTLNLVDVYKAQHAARLIMRGLSVKESDRANKTPLQYAEIIKNKFPETYKVMQAGKTKQNFEKNRVSKKNKNKMRKNAYHKAMGIITGYLS